MITKYSMNGYSQVRLLQDLNCTAAMQGAHHVIHLILPMPPPGKRRTANLNGSTEFELGSSKLHASFFKLFSTDLPDVHVDVLLSKKKKFWCIFNVRLTQTQNELQTQYEQV